MKAETGRIRGILFDLDGTLTDYNASMKRGLLQAYQALKTGFADSTRKPFSYRDFIVTYGRVIEAESAVTSSQGITLPAFENRINRFDQVCRRLGIQPDSACLQEMAKAYSSGRSTGSRLIPFVRSTLRYLKPRYRLGLITEGSVETQKAQLDRLNITSYFDDLIISGATPYHKPDVRLYEIALKQMEMRPAEILMVGDRLDWDIRPAKSLGMKTAFFIADFDRSSMLDCNGLVDWEIHSIAELKTLGKH